MTFGQLIEYNMKNIFVEKSYTMWEIFFAKNQEENEAGRLVSNLYLVFKKFFMR